MTLYSLHPSATLVPLLTSSEGLCGIARKLQLSRAGLVLLNCILWSALTLACLGGGRGQGGRS